VPPGQPRTSLFHKVSECNGSFRQHPGGALTESRDSLEPISVVLSDREAAMHEHMFASSGPRPTSKGYHFEYDREPDVWHPKASISAGVRNRPDISAEDLAKVVVGAITGKRP
jgi:hypothetical protein